MGSTFYDPDTSENIEKHTEPIEISQMIFFKTAYVLLSQPNNNHNSNNKTTITVVGLRLSNRWEYHHHPPPTHPHKLKTT